MEVQDLNATVVMPEQEAPEKEEGDWLSLYPGNTVVRNATVSFQAQGKKNDLRIKELLFVHKPDDIRVSLSGAFNNMPLSLKSNMKQPGNLMKISGRLARLDVSAEGTVDVQDSQALPKLDLQVRLRAPDLVMVAGKKLGKASVTGPVSLQARLHGENTWQLSGLEFSSNGSHLKVRGKGEIRDLFALDGMNISWTAESDDLAAVLQSAGVLNDAAFLKGKVTASARLTKDAKRFSLSDLEANLDRKGVQMKASGSVEDLQKRTGVNLGFSLKASSLESLGIKGIRTEAPVRMTGILKDGSGAGALAMQMEMNGDHWEMQAHADVVPGDTNKSSAWEASLKADDLSVLGRMLALKMNPVKPVHASLQIRRQGERLQLKDIDLVAGKSDLRGDLNILLDSDASKSRTSGKLRSRLLDLNAMFPQSQPEELKVLKNVEIESVVKSEAMEKQPRVFSSRSLPVDWIKKVVLQMQLEIGVFRGLIMEVHDVQTPVSISDGKLRMSDFRASLGGRPLKGKLQIDVARPSPAYELQLAVEDMDLALAFPGVQVAKGQSQMLVDLDVTGQGRSIAEIVASMNGEILLGLKNYPVGSGLPEELGESVIETINPEPQQKSVLECGALYFSVKDGVATTPRGLAAVFKRATWLGQGELNLKTEKIWLSFKPLPRRGFGIRKLGLAGLIMLGGNLSSPAILIDPKGAIGSSLSYMAAVSTGGASLLLEGLLNKARANQDVCAEIITGRVLLPDPPKTENTQQSILDD
ncbi:MAG TPA: AsmA family protein [Thiolapillus brandeum]|uniref:AsmA family protein n=1 Tax=Thiolapillus brandeum TaxID=1076588 RepID=A0A831RWI9_9GAMM|nr:AsmA family protein [Thiolapillus brandeum]